MRHETSHSPALVVLLAAALALAAAVLLPATALADEPAQASAPQTVTVESQAVHVNAANLATWDRLAGKTALDTMKKIVQEGWTGTSDYAVVASLETYHDALAASALAGELNAPVLLTPTSYLSQKTADELVRLKVKTAYIVGGSAAVSAHTEEQIGKYGIQTKRVAGANAQLTSVAVAKEVADQGSKTVVVATSAGYWDALAIGPYSFASKSPIFLTNTDGSRLLDEAIAQIDASGATQAIITGGEGAIKPSVAAQLEQLGLSVTRLKGANAYGTAVAIADYCTTVGMGVKNLAVATGTGHYDALCGAALCGKNETVLLLADGKYTEDTFDFLVKHNTLVHNAYILGGSGAVSQDVEGILKAATQKDAETVQLRIQRAKQFVNAYLSEFALADPSDDSTATLKNMEDWKAECRTYVKPSTVFYEHLGLDATYWRGKGQYAKKVYVVRLADDKITMRGDVAASSEQHPPAGWTRQTVEEVTVNVFFASDNLIESIGLGDGKVQRGLQI